MQATEDGLTRKQLQALRLAHENGYFSVPRESSLAEIGEELDVSTQSVSERLRRGLTVVLEREMCEEGEDD